jgi:hypothetical protein
LLSFSAFNVKSPSSPSSSSPKLSSVLTIIERPLVLALFRERYPALIRLLRPPPADDDSLGLASTAGCLVGLGEGFPSRIEFERILSDEWEGRSRRIDD